MQESRRGARIPASGVIQKQATAEVGVEIGLMVNIDTEQKEGQINMEDAYDKVLDKVNDIFEIDNRDKVLNKVILYAVQ